MSYLDDKRAAAQYRDMEKQANREMFTEAVAKGKQAEGLAVQLANREAMKQQAIATMMSNPALADKIANTKEYASLFDPIELNNTVNIAKYGRAMQDPYIDGGVNGVDYARELMGK